MQLRIASTLALLLATAAAIAKAEEQKNQNQTHSQETSCGPSSRYVVAYYPTWKRQSLMNVDWSKITHVNVGYGIPTDSGEFTFDGEWFLPQLVRDARKEKTKVAVSIGGWTGSNRLSTIMQDAHKRAALIRAIGAFVEKHELDGVDISWEYVGRQGSKCNKFSSADDAGNMLRFLRTLRASFHARFGADEKLISVAAPMLPFTGPDGPLKDVSAFAEYVDYASLMAFDVNGAWSNTTGPNAPLEFEKSRGAQYSLTHSVDQWLGAKWPADKLVAGVSFQGRSLTTRSVITAKEGAEMYAAFDKDVPQGDEEDALWYDVCENSNAMSGVWQYKHLRDQGVLKTPEAAGDDWVRLWDKQSSTPWLYNPQMRRFVSYDDPKSAAAKVAFASSKGLRGMMAWALHADFNHELLGTLGAIGPLCRGKRSDSDAPPSSSSSSSSSSFSSSFSSSWTPSPPFASLPTQPTTTSSSSSSTFAPSEPSTSPSPSASSASAEPTSEQLPLAPPPELSPSFPPPEQSSSVSLSTTKAILFDSQGVPYMVVDGQSTPVPSELAEKIMQVAEHSTSNSSSSSGSGSDSNSGTQLSTDTSKEPLAIPVVDSPSSLVKSNDSLSTTRRGLVAHPSPTNLFDTVASPLSALSAEHPLSSSSSAATAGFAATFFLTLDTNTLSTTNGVSTAAASMSTTVIPFSQMMANAISTASAASKTTTPHADLLSESALLELASDPLATTTSTTHP
ncbi:hypothetical protein IWW48_003856 [Coemansia sp. RSA 1200]|nr:hypothetical protein IWW48_003856 [Coemansia sp. RSA 1200]